MSEYYDYAYSSERSRQIREQERKRQEEERRKQAELRRREELDRMGRLCLRSISELEKRLEQLETSNLKEFFEKGLLSAARKDTAGLKKRARNTPTERDLQDVKKKMKALERDVDRSMEAAQKRRSEYIAKLERDRKRKEAGEKRNHILHQLDELAAADSANLVSDNRGKIRASIETCERELSADRLDEALTRLNHLQGELQSARKILADKTEILEIMQTVLRDVEKMSKDPVYGAWISRWLTELKNRIMNRMAQVGKDARFKRDAYETMAREDQAALEGHIREADARQENELVRRDVLTALMEAMREEGFTVSSPVLEGGQDSDVIVSGKKPGRGRDQAVTIRMGLSGRVGMDFDGGDPGDVARIREAQVDHGRENNVVCHQMALQLKEVLAKKGVVLEEKKRRWHNPDRIAKGARDLPWGAGGQADR